MAENLDSQRQKLDREISTVSERLKTNGAQLRIAVDRWDDWKAGNLRSEIAADQRKLLNLTYERNRLEPITPKTSRAIFTGSPF